MRYHLAVQSTTGMSAGIPLEKNMDSSLSILPKTLLVVIMYPIYLLFVCLTKRKTNSFYMLVVGRNSFRNYYTGYVAC